MQIWFYVRQCQVGDYVYHDGVFSDKLDKSRTVMGVCFYIDSSDPSHRLLIGKEDLSASGYCAWGLMNDATRGIPGITLERPIEGFSVYDTSLPNLSASKITSPITVEKMKDESNPDGIAVFSSTHILGPYGYIKLTSDIDYRGRYYSAGQTIPWGLYNTLLLMKHRDTILGDNAINLPVPKASGNETEYEALVRLIKYVIVQNDNATKYQQYYYPALSLCHHYEPTVPEGQELLSKFKAGNWFLGTSGDMARVTWYYLQDASSPLSIFNNKMSDGVFKPLTAKGYWSSDEINSSMAVVFIITNGTFTSTANSTNGQKWIDNVVRPICAF